MESFLISLDGERIKDVGMRLGYNHRGIENDNGGYHNHGFMAGSHQGSDQHGHWYGNHGQNGRNWNNFQGNNN